MIKTLIREVIYIDDCDDQMNFKLGLSGSSEEFPNPVVSEIYWFLYRGREWPGDPLPLTEVTASFIPNGVVF